jgi:hypothetical protein
VGLLDSFKALKSICRGKWQWLEGLGREDGTGGGMLDGEISMDTVDCACLCGCWWV